MAEGGDKQQMPFDEMEMEVAKLAERGNKQLNFHYNVFVNEQKHVQNVTNNIEGSNIERLTLGSESQGSKSIPSKSTPAEKPTGSKSSPSESTPAEKPMVNQAMNRKVSPAGEKYELKVQLYIDEETLYLECLFWTQGPDLSEFRGLKKKPTIPLQMFVSDSDIIHFRFATSDKHQYEIGDEIVQTLCARYFNDHTYKISSYRIDTSPNDIKYEFVDINFYIRVNDGKEETVSFRIKSKKGQDGDHSKNGNLFVNVVVPIGNTDNSSNVTRTMVRDSARYAESNENCSTTIPGSASNFQPQNFINFFYMLLLFMQFWTFYTQF